MRLIAALALSLIVVTATDAASSHPVRVNEGIAGIQFGLTQAQVAARLGKPYAMSLPVGRVTCGMYARVKDFVVPLDYADLPESLEQSGRIVDVVTIRLRASDAILRNLTEDRLSASIDLAHVPLGEQRIQLTDRMLRVPAGTEVVRISPAVIPVRIEKRARRQVPIVAEFSGRPPKGYEKTGVVTLSIIDDFGEVRDHPLFKEISRRLDEYITPYNPETWRSPKDATAREFYVFDLDE